MARKHERKTRPALSAQIRERDIPVWVHEVKPKPPMSLPELFTLARLNPCALGPGPYKEFFETLADRAQARVAGEGGLPVLVDLLDLVP
ncbi:MAG: hypothetical protein ACYC8T_27705, partial [Myxococcaceae bacterium]